VAIRAVARDRARASAVFRNSLGIKVAPAVGMVIALALLARWLRPEADVRLVCALLAISAVMRSYLLTIRGVLQGLEAFGWDAAVVLVDRVLLLVVSAIVLLRGGTLVALGWAFVGSRAIAVIGAFALTARKTGHPVPAFDDELWRELPRLALPLGAFLIVLNLYSYIDTVMLGVMSTDADTGLYNAAYRVYEGLSYAPAVISSVLLPRLSRAYVADRAQYAHAARRALAWTVGLAVILAVAIWAAAPLALSILFGSQFANAVRALRLLALGLVAVFPIWILHSVAISSSAERVLLRTTAIGVIVNVGVNLVLIPAAGRDGAAIATVVGEVVSLAVLAHGLRGALARPV
jgi:O-antigen/teichoic acid export membrane protein